MKLQLTIPTRPRLIHVLPVLDLIALVLAVPLLVKQFAPIGGESVVLPETRFRIPSFENATVIEVLNGAELQIFLDQEGVREEELFELLALKKEQWTHAGPPVVLLKIDRYVTQEQSMRLKSVLLNMDFDVFVVGRYKE